MPVLSRTQQNDVYKLAEGVGLNPLDFASFARDESHRGHVEGFIHRPTQSWISFSLAHEAKLWTQWWPFFRAGMDHVFAPDWSGALQFVRPWIDVVKKNDDAPDLWAEARKARELSDEASRVDADNTPFNLAEIELLKPKLVEIEAFIASRQPLDENQKRELHGRFQYLLGAAKRGVGRIDWLNIVVAQIMTLFTSGMLHSGLYGDVMRHAHAALGSIVHFVKLLGS